MRIFLSKEDTILSTVTTAKRYFPFRTEAGTTWVSATNTGSTADLLFRAYCDGANSFSSTATMVVAIPSAADMGEAGSTTSIMWKSDAAGTAYAIISGTTAGAVADSNASGTGVIGYKIAA